MGITTGYGSTTWGQIVPGLKNQSKALLVFLPRKVNEGGFLWGAVAGYELLPVFALEWSYLHYPDATIYFSPFSYFAFDHDESTQFTSHTESMAILGKFMFYIPHTSLRVFSSIGPALLHRWDIIKNYYRITPAFGAGFNYPMTEHVGIELAFNYVSGYGESELKPVQDFMPFLYAGVVNLVYRF